VKPGPHLEIELTEAGGVEILGLRGEVDLANAASLERALLQTGAKRVVLDLSLLAYLDSAGIKVIHDADRKLATEARALIVVAPPGSTAAWTLRVAGFGDRLVVDSLAAALGGESERGVASSTGAGA
jgi:anti-anti-sigma factor